MAKLKSVPVTAADMNDYLRGTSDFSFELQVLKALRQVGIDCEHGGLYEDPVTKKSREFDIRATVTQNAARLTMRVRLAIECKNIRDNFPLLVSCVPRHSSESFHEVALLGGRSDNNAPYVPAFESKAKILKVRDQYSLYPHTGTVGKSIAQVGRGTDDQIVSNDSEVFEKWGQCLSSADDLVTRSYSEGADEPPGDDGKTPIWLCAVIPILVIPSGRLWSVQYDFDGNVQSPPALVDRVSIFIDKEYEMDRMAHAYMRLTHIEVMTLDGLNSFIAENLSASTIQERVFSPAGMLDAFRGSPEGSGEDGEDYESD